MWPMGLLLTFMNIICFPTYKVVVSQFTRTVRTPGFHHTNIILIKTVKICLTKYFHFHSISCQNIIKCVVFALANIKCVEDINKTLSYNSCLKFKYKIKTTIHDEICITPHINPRQISAIGPKALPLILESWVDMGCDRDFAMYYSLFIICFHYIPWISPMG